MSAEVEPKAPVCSFFFFEAFPKYVIQSCPVFLHHLGLDRLVDTPEVESQVVGSLVHRSANRLLHLFLKHLVVMAVLLSIVPKTPLSRTPQRTSGTYDGELVNSELVDSHQKLNLHTLSFYS